MSLPILTTSNSVELQQVPPIAASYSPLKPSEKHGRVRIAAFTVALAAQAQNLLIGLCTVPKNARILESKIMIDGGPGANVNFDIGLSGADGTGNIEDTVGATVADSASYLGNFAPANAAAKSVFADTLANHAMYTAKKELLLTTTVKTAGVSVAATLKGYVKYVVD